MDERPRPGTEETPAVGDLPYVDGSAATPDELRTEVARQTDPQARQIEQLRGDVAATVDELGGRLDVRPKISHRLSQARPLVIAAAAPLAAVVLWRLRRSRRTADRGITASSRHR